MPIPKWQPCLSKALSRGTTPTAPPTSTWLSSGLIDQLQVTPPTLSPRLKQLFAIVSIDPLAAVYQLHDLTQETFRLVDAHLGEVDTHAARERFRVQRRTGEHAPDGLG
jgi:hypothetical protein